MVNIGGRRRRSEGNTSSGFCKVRRIAFGKGKSDPIDAHLAAIRAALDATRLPTPRADGDREAPRILLGARHDLTTAGTTQTNHPLTAASVFSQLDAAGLSWRSYEESMPANCDLMPASPYAVKHNPAAYFTALRGACAAHDVPIGRQLRPRRRRREVAVIFFRGAELCVTTPTTAQSPPATEWLATWIPKVISGPNYQAGDTLVVITWDEGTTTSNQVPAIVIAPSVRPGTVSHAALSHYSLLRITEDVFGLGHLGAAAR